MVTEKRIKLRQKKLSDAIEDYSWQIDPELSALDAALTLSISYQQYLAEYMFELRYPSANRFEFAIDTLNGEHIGNCVYYNVDTDENKAELGIMIGNRDYWDKGYGAEAVNTLLDYIFAKTSLRKIYLTTLVWNIRAQKCFKRCGFVECGQVHRDGSTFLVMVINSEERDRIRTLEIETKTEINKNGKLEII